MLGFLKIFLQGILYVVLLPFILLGLAFYVAYCLVIFIYMAIRSIIVFFMGGTPLGDLPEEVDAKRILMEREENKETNSTQALADALVQSQLQIAQSLYAQQTVNSAPQEEPTYSQPEFQTSDDLDENKEEETNDDLSN